MVCVGWFFVTICIDIYIYVCTCILKLSQYIYYTGIPCKPNVFLTIIVRCGLNRCSAQKIRAYRF